MRQNISANIEELRELCTKTVELLDALREKGRISEEEYQNHVYLKKKFLDDTSIP